MRLGAAAVLVAVLALAAPAWASEQRPTLGELEHEVMCPTCKTLLELSDAPVAQRMRAFIRRRIAAGETKSRIESQLVAEFGEGVLAEPPRRGFGLLAWLLPLGGLVGAAGVLALAGWRWAGGDEEAPAPAPPTARERRLERRLDEELARFDG